MSPAAAAIRRPSGKPWDNKKAPEWPGLFYSVIEYAVMVFLQQPCWPNLQQLNPVQKPDLQEQGQKAFVP